MTHNQFTERSADALLTRRLKSFWLKGRPTDRLSKALHAEPPRSNAVSQTPNFSLEYVRPKRPKGMQYSECNRYMYVEVRERSFIEQPQVIVVGLGTRSVPGVHAQLQMNLNV